MTIDVDKILSHVDTSRQVRVYVQGHQYDEFMEICEDFGHFSWASGDSPTRFTPPELNPNQWLAIFFHRSSEVPSKSYLTYVDAGTNPKPHLLDDSIKWYWFEDLVCDDGFTANVTELTSTAIF